MHPTAAVQSLQRAVVHPAGIATLSAMTTTATRKPKQDTARTGGKSAPRPSTKKASANASKKARAKPKKKAKGKRASRYTAATADRHVLYQMSVQNVESEIDFVDDTYRKLRKRRATTLREDFCGTGNTSCEWVRRRKTNVATGLDIDQATLDWGRKHNVESLPEEDRHRVHLLNSDVLNPGKDAGDMDIVLAMNFSYWIFKTRPELRAYFAAVRTSLATDGIFFLDFYGGSEAHVEQEEERAVGPFTYIWDQHTFDPLTGHMKCHIHFRFKDKTEMRRAFTYEWRLWSMPEILELLDEAGFRQTAVYLEGDDGEGGGDGEFKPAKVGDPCETWLAYIVAQP